MGYIGGQKKGHFRRFCEVLPIFFEKNDVGGENNGDEIFFYENLFIENEKMFVEHLYESPAPLGLARQRELHRSIKKHGNSDEVTTSLDCS